MSQFLLCVFILFGGFHLIHLGQVVPCAPFSLLIVPLLAASLCLSEWVNTTLKHMLACWLDVYLMFMRRHNTTHAIICVLHTLCACRDASLRACREGL